MPSWVAARDRGRAATFGVRRLVRRGHVDARSPSTRPRSAAALRCVANRVAGRQGPCWCSPIRTPSPSSSSCGQVNEEAPELAVIGGLACPRRGTGRQLADRRRHASGRVVRSRCCVPTTCRSAVVSQGCRPSVSPTRSRAPSSTTCSNSAATGGAAPPGPRARRRRRRTGPHAPRPAPRRRRGRARVSTSAGATSSCASPRRGPGRARSRSATTSTSARPCSSRSATRPPPTRTSACSSTRSRVRRLAVRVQGTRRAVLRRPDHDAAAVQACLGDVPLAGAFCAGEIGPVGERNFLHGFTASVAIFGD